MSKGQRFSLDKPLDNLQAHLEKRASQGSLLGGEGTMDLPLERLQAAPWNARRFFSQKGLLELAQDLKAKGQIHPILVRPLGQGFEVVVGERRLRAARIAGLPSLKAQVRNLSDREAQGLSLSENLSRTDLNAYEETLGYLQLLELELSPLPEFVAIQRAGEKPEQTVARLLHQLNNERKLAIGETKGTVLEEVIRGVFETNRRIGFESFYKHRLPILKFPEDLIAPMQEGSLEYSKAALLVKIKDNAERQRLLGETLEHSLSVAALRKRVDRAGEGHSLNQRASRLARLLKRSQLGPEKGKQVEELLGQLEKLLGSS